MRFESLGKSFELRFNFNALAALEDTMGQSITSFGENWQPGFRDLRAMLWAGLLHQDKNLTIAEAGNIADGIGDVGALGELIMGALTKSLSQSKKK